VAADALAIIKGLESGNIYDALLGLEDFESLLSSSAPAAQRQLELALINDLLSDL
jgi:hypothetical protein